VVERRACAAPGGRPSSATDAGSHACW
jgi:hypothetical protein